MKALVLILLFLNVAFGLWEYERPVAAGVPRPVHAERLRLVPRTAVTTPPALKPPDPLVLAPQALPAPPSSTPPPKAPAVATPGPARPAPAVATPLKPVADLVSRAAALRAGCWQLGPFPGRAQALYLLHRLRLLGHVFSRVGAPAYRVFLPVAVPWPSAQILMHLGVRGAYVTHGPAGGEVLSLGVFVNRAAAITEFNHLRKGHLAVRMAPFGAPTHYYAKIHLARIPAGLWQRLGSVGHHVCRHSQKAP
ncbi:MAG: hypothetical protein ACYDEV_16780 [Acidiferrobacter sp.]